MEKSARAEKIILQAPQWNFEGDCSLLAWMKELSENLEQRASTTSRALQQLNINVNRAAISLDNAANSLTALQYTQFVESRCHDDDDIVATTPDVPAETNKVEEQTKSSNEMLQTFLRNNLEMLHNCHEKYALDLEDSDEEEAANNCIYQPKNPYNDALLPHIYGSKLWKEYWHIGLCDGDNEYSGDEQSEAFSESSTSAEDNESYESNTANLSEWASSTSIPNESKHPALIAVQNAASLHASTADLARDKPVNSAMVGAHVVQAAGSDTSSTNSRSTTTNPPHIREHDLFADLKDTPTTSSGSSTSAQQHIPANSSSASSSNRYMAAPPFYETIPPNDIFAEPTQSAPIVEPGTLRTASNQIKRKPVNLFDDDDFNSFMTEIVDKAQTKVEPPVPAARKMSANNEKAATVEQPPKKVIDLFDDSLQSNSFAAAPPKEAKQTSPKLIQKPKETTRKQPLGLFDSPEGSPTDKAPLFATSQTTAKEVDTAEVQAPIPKTRITAKSLFDDDDDDDFLNVFGTKKLTVPQTTGRTLLFDDVDDDIINGIGASNGITKTADERKKLTTLEQRNLFDNEEPSVASSSPPVQINKDATESKTMNVTNQTKLNNNNIQEKKPLDLFGEVDTLSENKTEQAVQNSVEAGSKIKETAKPSSKMPSNLFGANLFDDNDDEIDELFAKKKSNSKIDEKPTSEQTKQTERSNNKISQLFEDNLDNDFNDDLFSKPPTKKNENINDKTSTVDALAPPELNISTTNVNTVLDKTEVTNDITCEPPPLDEQYIKTKSKPLFVDDFDDNDDDDYLFGKVKENVAPKSTDKPALNITTKTIVPTESNAPLRGPTPDIDQTTIITTESPILNEIKTAIIATPRKLALFKENDTLKTVVTKEEQESVNVPSITAKQLDIFEPPDVGILTTDTNIIARDIEAANKTTLGRSFTNEKDQTSHTESEKEIPDLIADTNTASDISAEQPIAQEPIVQQASANPHNFSGIFLDEPPDDDDFFQTLSNNSKLSPSKFTLDIEHDFYEPNLPALPNAPKDANKTELPSSDYGGLRLFSEIPPDDDDSEGNDFNFGAASSRVEQPTNRLHSVFYDDFTETLEAVQQISESKMLPTHSLFDDEPPSDSENFDVIDKYAKVKADVGTKRIVDEKQQNVITKDENAIQTATSSKNDDKSLETAADIVNDKISEDVTDRVVVQTTPKVEKSHNSTGKLQMPKININVQALLPGAGARPNFKKSTEEQTQVATSPLEESSKESRTLKTPTDTTQVSNSTSASTLTAAANENVLSNMCKHRVRAPAKRRPSTRKARQENYRKSLLAEQEEPSDDVAAQPENSVKSSANEHLSKEQIINKNISPVEDVEQSKNRNVSNAKQNIPNLFANKAEDDDYDTLLFSPKKTAKPTTTLPTDISTPTSTLTTKNPTQANVIAASIQKPPQHTVSRKATAAHFNNFLDENDDDDDDDLFRSVRASTGNSAAAHVAGKTGGKQRVKNTSNALFTDENSDESDDNLFKSSLASKSQPEVATSAVAQIKPIATINKKVDSLFGSDDGDDADDDFLAQLKQTNKSKISFVGGNAKPSGANSLFSDAESDEDDLFGSKTKVTKGNTKQTSADVKRAVKTPATTSNSAKPATLTDNPLADLLDS